jgi:ABC-2 type transport system permease protein
VLTSLFDLCMNLIAVLGLALVSGIAPRVSWAELPLILLVLTALVTGISLLLSALYVRLRDLDHIWLVFTQGLFYATPVFYVVTSLGERGSHLALLLNPLASVFTELRHAIIDPAAPSAAAAIGGAHRLAAPLGIVLAVLLLGVVVFRRASLRAAEHL